MYERLLAHNVQYGGLTFISTPHSVGEGALVLKEFSFFEVPSVTNVSKYAMRHGEYVSPRENMNRRVKILFDIIAPTPEKRWRMLRKVHRAFAPAYDPSPTNPEVRKKLTFMDIDGNTWQMNMQVTKGLQLSDYANQHWMGLSVELIAQSPTIFSESLHTVEDRNRMMGFTLGMKLGLRMDACNSSIQDYQGLLDVPLSTRIVAQCDNALPLQRMTLYRKNQEVRTILQLENLELNQGDMVEIDGLERQIRKTTSAEGRVNITGLVTLNSQWPSLTQGDNYAIIDAETIEPNLRIWRQWRDMF